MTEELDEAHSRTPQQISDNRSSVVSDTFVKFYSLNMDTTPGSQFLMGLFFQTCQKNNMLGVHVRQAILSWDTSPIGIKLHIFRNPVIFLNGHGLFSYFPLRWDKYVFKCFTSCLL